MAKLYFRYGTMDSAKTLNLLAVAHNYRKQGKRVVLAKPALDVRFGDKSVASRAGLQGQADLLLASWLGADFSNRSERVYRLLGCDLTFMGELPKGGETLHYEIHIDGARAGLLHLAEALTAGREHGGKNVGTGAGLALGTGAGDLEAIRPPFDQIGRASCRERVSSPV